MSSYRFRFWLEAEQRWFYFGFETFLTYKEQIGKALDDGFEIFQSTGLKDIKGKEIFEGDIVSFQFYNPQESSYWKVIYNEDSLEFALTSGVNYMKFSSQDIINNKIKVVGHIREGEE